MNQKRRSFLQQAIGFLVAPIGAIVSMRSWSREAVYIGDDDSGWLIREPSTEASMEFDLPSIYPVPGGSSLVQGGQICNLKNPMIVRLFTGSDGTEWATWKAEISIRSDLPEESTI